MPEAKGRWAGKAAQLSPHLAALAATQRGHRPLHPCSSSTPSPTHRPESLPEPHRGSISWALTSNMDVRGRRTHGPGQDSTYLPPRPFPGEEAGGWGRRASLDPRAQSAVQLEAASQGRLPRASPAHLHLGVPELVYPRDTPHGLEHCPCALTDMLGVCWGVTGDLGCGPWPATALSQ